MSLAGTTVSLQQTVVVALLPGFAQLFGISPDDVSWLITATLLTARSLHRWSAGSPTCTADG